MPEYTFNPETGSAEQTVNGKFSEEPQGPSLQEQADLDSARSFANTSAYLNQKRHNITDVGVAEDERVSLGKAQAEQQLILIQQELYNCNDPTRSAILQQEAEQ